MRLDWRDLIRGFLQVAAFCLVVAVITTTIWPEDGYWLQVGYAICIGTFVWLPIELGRFLFLRPGETGWPKGWRGAALTVCGILIGFFVGSLVSQAIFGGGPLQGFMQGRRNRYTSLIITIAAGMIGSYFFHSRGQRAALDARLNAVERAAAEAKLKQLETQLEPHMLFNTLANLRVLIGADPPRAQRMLDHMIDYLRATLDGSRATTHPLQAEFDRLHDYLELMAIRMGPRLAYGLELPRDLQEARVPTLLLQPLVENSIQHGLEPKVRGGRIDVRAQREGDQLVLEVTDTGVGTAGGACPDGSGFGMQQIRDRLQALYGERGRLDFRCDTEGAQARIALPIA